jgi:hypothetical protein
MKNYFNKQRFLELIAESEKLRQEGKSLRDYDKAKDNELTHYYIVLETYIFWQSRSEYLEILQTFINESIDIDQFIKKFDNLRWSNREASQMLSENFKNEIDFQLNPESRGFTKIINAIDSAIETLNPDVTLDMNLESPDLIGYGISEEFLKIIIKNNFLPRIRKYCKKF